MEDKAEAKQPMVGRPSWSADFCTWLDDLVFVLEAARKVLRSVMGEALLKTVCLLWWAHGSS